MQHIRFRLKVFVAALVVVMLLGTLGFMVVENRSAVDSLYFIIVTVATVGYGDVHPVSTAGKILTVILIVTGVGIFLGVVANATEIMLSRREMESRLNKLHIVIGVFFSEVGTRLLVLFSDADPEIGNLREKLIINGNWSEKDFQAMDGYLKSHGFQVQADSIDIETVRTLLSQNRDFLVRLLENPSVLDHETFTDLLRAVFHLAEELSCRVGYDNLPHDDTMHLAGDMHRAYGLLLRQWIGYMRYLKSEYPYLFSLAMRTNPFDRSASPVIEP
ncbi:MAG: two pore domain potassium channel family protein [Nitrospirae bacterium]|nr:two pore domain potassium channel family protein [Nitrospirota bacterium]